MLLRTNADAGVKPHPREGKRNATSSATGVSNGTLDFDDKLRRKRAPALGADVGRHCAVNAARLTFELIDDAHPALL